MPVQPVFPTILHHEAADVVEQYFLKIANVDSILVVNSCARGLATPESDLDMAILVKPDTTADDMKVIDGAWQTYSRSNEAISKYRQSNQFAHLHLDIIDGNYLPALIEIGEPLDYFEVEIGNHICYSAPMGQPGSYFRELQEIWLPYYDDGLRVERLQRIVNACNYDIDHIPFFVKRGLYFQAFDILCKAFQEYLQTIFIANKTYPIAYNKWIKEQVVKWLNKPALYPKLSPILSISNIESDEINDKAKTLRELLNDVTNAL